ncbi:DegT/DnrJ/EryC1/StrS family aminotransferase, partial [Klebsiella pneumoniae]|uniref:DegT/DnrJ/EryC1/StrS family aminotransferase n=1 Tax=Klebsiella pneumoniae TaxID=573 RepID=UPI0020348255
MKIKRISDKEHSYINEVLNNSFRSSKGAEFMTKLEHQFCETFETNFSISHVNGTATMHSVLEAAGIGQGDEVI